jgi:aminoglycoside 3-N-acetyltransferase I
VHTDCIARLHKLGPTDIPFLRALNTLFGKAFDDPAAYEADSPSDIYLASVLAKEHVIVLVALVADQVVGGLVAYELDKLEQARRELYLYDLAVDPFHRRRGIATTLVKQLCEIARQRGAHAVYVQADYGDDPAIALYQKLGTLHEVLHFDFELSVHQG